MYFIIFKKDKRYRHYTNEIFQTEEEALDYAKGGYKEGTALETFNPLAKKANTANTFIEAVE